ncbi:hypothetical protein G3N95_23385 [Paraburkholderia sp. Tr-20389]|uniref:hypothetical protein n=1 Tax=Paraburkholderia sp. Tr-20389 TaxID=2703903 RepID=UPI0019820163|nr:hypothetical protein [Paraburkholderia sp. Tr-20389]MBN3755908.1 hypothetical protein [Paraburkholderia sp. Tr-20389]
MDDRESLVFNRDAVYRAVWRQRIEYAAGEWGISVEQLHVICRQLNVPIPGAGYWRGSNTPPPPRLPHYDGPAEIVIPLPSKPAPEMPTSEEASTVAARREFEQHNRIVVPANLVNPHAVTRQFKRKSKKLASYAEIGFAGIYVEGEHVDRALLVFDTFMKAAESRGFKPEALSGETRLSVLDVPIYIRMSVGEARGVSGLRMTARGRHQLHFSIRDDAQGPLEGKIGRLMTRAVEFAVAHKVYVRDFEAGNAWREQCQRIVSRAIDVIRSEQVPYDSIGTPDVESLVDEAARWQRAEVTRSYLAHLAHVAETKGYDLGPQSKLGVWLARARAACDAGDPTENRVAGWGEIF